MVKTRVECGEDVDQRDQVLVFSSLCHFCAKPLRPTSRFRLAWGFLLLFLVSSILGSNLTVLVDR